VAECRVCFPIMNAETLGVAQGCDRSHLWC
jgi:hypothetical protein